MIWEFITEQFIFMLESLAAPGNAIRHVYGVDPGLSGTIAVSTFFTMATLLGIVFEVVGRRVTGRDVFLIPNYIGIVQPDGGINVPAFLILFGVLQGPLSAII
jgi:hypothetical protein